METLRDTAGLIRTSVSVLVGGNSGHGRSADDIFDHAQQALADKEASRAKWSDMRKFVHKIIQSPAFDMSNVMPCLAQHGVRRP